MSWRLHLSVAFSRLLEPLKHLIDILHDLKLEVFLRLRCLLDFSDAAPNVESLFLIEFLSIYFLKTMVIEDGLVGGIILDRSMQPFS